MMIEAVASNQTVYLETRSETDRKTLGQYFTGSVVSDYMASMLKPDQPVNTCIRILDAGAGAGMLTTSAALRCLALGYTHVHAVLYELDEHVLDSLNQHMDQIKRQFKAKGAQFSFDIQHADFVLARPDQTELPFHLASINPPYFKYNSKTSPYATATTDLYKGNPNIYASFMAVVAACLAPGGQMMAIVPRSFTNGLYFKGFRQYLNRTLSLETIHIFRARNQVFRELDVLQENIICSLKKTKQRKSIEVCTSTGYSDLDQAISHQYSSSLIVDRSNEHEIIRIPESPEDASLLERVEHWPSSFLDNGYFISTGPVVEHRSRHYIVKPDVTSNSVPLLRMHNVKAFGIEWTGQHKKDVRFELASGHEKHTSNNLPYVLLKRFSSKDEKRRLVAGVHNPSTLKGSLIALENHLNYVGHQTDEMTLAEAYGLALLFNSTLLDRYFRCISGNTQVNATEIRLLKMPCRDIICKIGAAYLKSPNTDQAAVDAIIDHFISQ